MVYYIILVLVIILMGLWVWYLLKKKQENEKESALIEKERDEYAEMGRGLAEYNQRMQEKKDKAKEKILEMLKIKSKISNRDVAKILETSSATTRRYFDELQAEGKVKQIGKSGTNVYYKKT
jgi:predicted HTH transcriptional regulator